MSADHADSLMLEPQSSPRHANDPTVTSFEAHRDFLQRRHRLHRLPPKVVDNDIWKRLPPDFRLQAFEPRPPKRNSREAVQPEKYATPSDEYYQRKLVERKEKILSPLVAMRKSGGSDDEEGLAKFQTGFRVIRPGTAKRLFAARGMNKAGPYENPKLHDFRGLPPIKSLGLMEFSTAMKKDPYNIEFLLANRRTIVGPLHEIQNIRDASGTMDGSMEKPPKWDPRLHLPLDPWPAPLAEYSRHRCISQNPHEGFLTRVEEVLAERWRREKEEKQQLQQGSNKPQRRKTERLTSASALF